MPGECRLGERVSLWSGHPSLDSCQHDVQLYQQIVHFYVLHLYAAVQMYASTLRCLGFRGIQLCALVVLLRA